MNAMGQDEPAILVETSPGEARVAVAAGTTLLDYAIWRPGAPDGVGDLHRARVTALAPALAGAFVVLADGQSGFLPDSEGGAGLTEGTLLPVRVSRSAQGGKGPRLSARLPEVDRALAGDGPVRLVRRGPDPVRRFAALFPAAPVRLDDAALAASLRPDLGPRLTLAAHPQDAVAAEIEALAETVAELPGGLRASFHPTPALVAIDVDTGSASADRQAKQTAQFAANRAALPALARQIRLRNLSGAILLDLAGLSVRRRAALGPDLARALAEDPLGPRLLGFTALGLAEIVRRREHPPLHEMLAGPHAAGLAALRRIAAMAAAEPARRFGLRAAPEVAARLAADPVALPDLARRTGRTLVPVADPSLPRHGWVIEEIA
ncbi:MAG TPA: ribonuclease E/G [Acetobacteraceae bacterium]|nr:ribonuclease E/G [Acetobacteraceae bacterium]